MKKIILFLLSIAFASFSYLYYKRDDQIHVYSVLSEEYICQSDDFFEVNIFSNFEKTVYTNSNYLSFSLKDEKDTYKLSLLQINEEKEDDLYKITYKFESLKINKRCENLKLEIKSNDTLSTFTLGNYYFTDKIGKSKEFKEEYNELNNLSKLSINISKELSVENILVNDLNQNYSIEKDEVNNTTLFVDISFPYFTHSLLVTIKNIDYLVCCDSFNLLYLKEASYDSI